MEDNDRSWRLPRIDVPRWTRATSWIVREVWRQHHLNLVILDEFEHRFPEPSVIVAEALPPTFERNHKGSSWKRLSELALDELQDSERTIAHALLTTGTTKRGRLSRLRWIEEVVAWSALTIGAVSSDIDVHQVNGTRDSALIRLEVKDGRSFWFKSVGYSLDSEYSITRVMHDMFPEYLPTAVAHHDEWRAWLMEDAGLPLEGFSASRPRLVEEVGRQLACLHRASQSAVPLLLQNGADDQRVEQLSTAVPDIIEGLRRIANMSGGASIRYPRGGLRGLEETLKQILGELDELEIPDTLLHGDLNSSNILIDEGTCVFTDWGRSSVGNPIANLAQLRLQVLYDPALSDFHSRLLAGYQRAWSEQLSESQVERALKLMPPVTLCMYLYTRRDWFVEERMRDADFVRFAYNMSRQLQRAVTEFENGLAITA